jgi:hypothetical protein
MSTEKSFYEIYRERVKEAAAKLEKAPKEIPQHILWLKSSAVERIEEIDKLSREDEVYTLRVHNGKEVSLTEAIKLKDEKYKYGFSEHYVNLLMHYAYEAGLAYREDSYKRSIEGMHKALKDIACIVQDAGYLDE